jgi:hypothetical protein
MENIGSPYGIVSRQTKHAISKQVRQTNFEKTCHAAIAVILPPRPGMQRWRAGLSGPCSVPRRPQPRLTDANLYHLQNTFSQSIIL